MVIKHTKIVATIGPSTNSFKKIKLLYERGVNVFRLNFSHADHSSAQNTISMIRKVSDSAAILLDTKGPEIRTGEVEGGEVFFSEGDVVELVSSKILGSVKKLTISYRHLLSIPKGSNILLDDGLIELEVLSKRKSSLIAKVIGGGLLGSHKTVSVRGHEVSLPFLSSQDKKDILFGIQNNVDFIAASFVRNSKEVVSLRRFLQKNGGSHIHIISKIEHSSAVKNFNSILDVSDGIMVARGDLGVEVSLEKVPQIQKMIIDRCNHYGKPVIVATQMLESMKNNPSPTRAEVNDVALAITQGADAIMLSGETASGKYPLRSVSMMVKIAKEYELNSEYKLIDDSVHDDLFLSKNLVSLYISRAAYSASKNIGVRAIVTPTETGYTPRKVSRFRPIVPIYAISRNKTVVRQLQMVRGVFPRFDSYSYKNHGSTIMAISKKLFSDKLINLQDTVVFALGHISGRKGKTNLLEIYRVNDILKK